MSIKVTSKRRWECALHESGHIEIGRVLNHFDTMAAAMLDSDGGGVAILPDGLTPWQSIIAVAAAIHAEKLADRHAPPKLEEPEPPKLPAGGAAQTPRTVAEEFGMGWHKKAAMSDEESIATHCIRGRFADPDDWVFQFKRIHDQAAKAVAKHEKKIIETAAELFKNSWIFYQGNDEDNEFFADGMGPEAQETNTNQEKSK